MAKPSYDDVKPLASVAEGSSDSPNSNLSTDELNKQLGDARNEAEKDKKNLDESEKLLNQTIDQAKAAKDDYEAKKGEWERLQGISDKISGEYARLNNIAQEAQKNVTTLTNRILGLNGTIDSETDLVKPAIADFEKAEKRVAVLEDYVNELAKAEKETERLQTEFDLETGKVTTLAGQLIKDDAVITGILPNVKSFQLEYDTYKCSNAANAIVRPCSESISRLNDWKGKLDTAQRNRNTTFDNHKAAEDKAKELKSSKRTADNIANALKRDGLNLNGAKNLANQILEAAKFTMETQLKPLNEATAERAIALVDLEKAITTRDEANAKVSTPSPEAIEAEKAAGWAFNAQDKAEILKTARHDAISKKRSVFEANKKIWEDTNARVEALQKQVEKRTVKGGMNPTIIYVIVGLALLCLAIVGVVIGLFVYRKKRLRRQSNALTARGGNSGAATHLSSNGRFGPWRKSSSDPQISIENTDSQKEQKRVVPASTHFKRFEILLDGLKDIKQINEHARAFIEEHLKDGGTITIHSRSIARFPMNNGGLMDINADGTRKRFLRPISSWKYAIGPPKYCNYAREREWLEEIGVAAHRLSDDMCMVMFVRSTMPAMPLNLPRRQRRKDDRGGRGRMASGSEANEQPTEQEELAEHSISSSSLNDTSYAVDDPSDEPYPTLQLGRRAPQPACPERDQAGLDEAVPVDQDPDRTQLSVTEARLVTGVLSAEPEGGQKDSRKSLKEVTAKGGEGEKELSVAKIPSVKEAKIPSVKEDKIPSAMKDTSTRRKSSGNNQKNRSNKELGPRKSKNQSNKKSRDLKKKKNRETKKREQESSGSSEETSADSTTKTRTISAALTEVLNHIVNPQNLTRRQLDGIIRRLASGVRNGDEAKIKDLIAILDEMKFVFIQEPKMLPVSSPVTVVTDIHGNLEHLMQVFHSYGLKGKAAWEFKQFLFLGDMVDRGEHSIEVIMLLFLLKLRHPDKVRLLRGNHEDPKVNMMYGFNKEIERYYPDESEKVKQKFKEVFARMPLCALIDNNKFATHGGIPSKELDPDTLDRINDLPAVIEDVASCELAMELLWNDPCRGATGFPPNHHRGGAGKLYGEKDVENFCDKHKLKMVIRGHQMMYLGHEFFAGDKLLTVFTSVNYFKGGTNHGATIDFEPDGRYGIRIYVNIDDIPVEEETEERLKQKFIDLCTRYEYESCHYVADGIAVAEAIPSPVNIEDSVTLRS